MANRDSLMRRARRAVLTAILLAVALSMPPGRAAAQETAPEVRILPVDRATFLAGATFDMRIEVHAEALPDDFAVSINGDPADSTFGAPLHEAWTIDGDDALQQPVQSVTWRGVALEAAGAYTVSVTAGGKTNTARWEVRPAQASAGARNVVLFIADGMTVPLMTAARVISRGNPGGKFSAPFTIDQMPEVGLIHTSGLDSIITDSANSASAYNSGHKAANNALGTYLDTSPDTLDDPRVETFAELVKRTRGMSVGIVTTADWTDATPAAIFAHTRSRDDRSLIASSALDSGLLPEVILGGGLRYMLPASADGSARDDERDLLAEYEAAGYMVVQTRSELTTTVAGGPPERLLGVFQDADMNSWLDRNVFTATIGAHTDQPGLDDMTLAALDVLNQNENGFYLMVEAAGIDKSLHPLDADRALADLIEFDNAVRAAIGWLAEHAPDTLVIVTSDHGHGYDVYGTVDTARMNAAADDAARRNSIRVYARAGFPTYTDDDGDGFPDDWTPSITLAGLSGSRPDSTEDFQANEQPRVPALEVEEGTVIDNPDDDPNGFFAGGTLPMESEGAVHTLQDVPVFAAGPGAAYFGAVLDNTDLFFGMAYALGLDPLAADGIADPPQNAKTLECAGVVFGGACFTQ